MINKLIASADEAVADVPDQATILVGGFGFCGVPENLLAALVRRQVRGLTVVSDDAGFDGWGVGLLHPGRQVSKMIVGRAPNNAELARQIEAGETEVDFVPLGTLAERIRAGGCGIPAFYTPVGVGTVVAEGKEVREFDGRPHLLERAIVGDFALVAAWKGDRLGNLVYRESARNSNPVVAAAGRVCIAEVEELVAVGELDPNHVHTPGILVHRVVVARREKAADRGRAALGRG